jgi:hypothetical protein
MLYCTSTSTRNEDILPWQLLWSTKGIRSFIDLSELVEDISSLGLTDTLQKYYNKPL